MKLRTLAEELLTELSPEEIYQKYYTGYTSDQFYKLATVDPQTEVDTTNRKILRLGKYAKLVIDLYKKGGFKYEDRDKLKEYLGYVYKYRVPLDVNKVSNTGDIFTLVEKYMARETEDMDVIAQSLVKDKDYKILYNGKDWTIYQPLTERGACYLGVGTQWCTTWGKQSLNPSYKDRENRFDYHNKQGPLYIMINKKNQEEKYQFHFPTSQYKDRNDRSVSTSYFFEEHPEIKNYFFPSFYRQVDDETLDWESANIGLLSAEDAALLLHKIIDVKEITSELALAIINHRKNEINELITDDDLTGEITIYQSYKTQSNVFIEFSVKSIQRSDLEEVESTLAWMEMDKTQSYDRVYSEYHDTDFDDIWWIDYMESIFKEYYEDNKDKIRPNLYVKDYDEFKDLYFNDFCDNDDIRDEVVSENISQNDDEYSVAVENEIKSITKYINIINTGHQHEISANLVYFVKYIIKEDIEKIENNLLEVLEGYCSHYGINSYYEGWYEYDRVYVGYNNNTAVQNIVYNYFDEIMDNYEEYAECKVVMKKFRKVYEKYFENGKYENEHVVIDINNPLIDCEDLTLDIKYFNKDTGKKYEGNINPDNLYTYMTNYTLFEQKELDELHGVSFEARVWNPIILSYIKIARAYYNKRKEIPDMTIRGNEYPKQYQSFPIDQIKIKVNPDYGGGAAYDENNSGYDQNGEYIVYFVFGVDAGASSINHELRHAFEDYKRNSKGVKPLKQTKEASMLFGGDFEKFMMSGDNYTPFTSLMHGLYYTSKIERSGYSETIYDNPIGMISVIKNIMDGCNYSKIITNNKPEIMQSSWDKLKEKYRVPIFDKFSNYNDFIKWACDEINYKGQKTLKKLRNVQYQSQLKQQKEKEGQ